MQRSPSSKCSRHSVKEFPPFMELEGSLPFSQEPITGPNVLSQPLLQILFNIPCLYLTVVGIPRIHSKGKIVYVL